MPIVLPGLPGLAARSAVEGAWHGLWHKSDVEHRFWLTDAPPVGPASFVVVLPFDTLFELRAEAALRFWLALAGRPPGDRWRQFPPQTRERHILILRALDAKLAGASYRVIAEALLGFRGRSKNDWEVSPLKNQVRRLVADGLFYMRGGYRQLLHYPARLRNRR
ncbi:uncharacterized protein DUF2285 [Rhizobium sp. PP-CC-2G-626]|nr:uncharacterized protein DUF2285 [Rhizobium sp. PP-CC-2G-626]